MKKRRALGCRMKKPTEPQNPNAEHRRMTRYGAPEFFEARPDLFTDGKADVGKIAGGLFDQHVGKLPPSSVVGVHERGGAFQSEDHGGGTQNKGRNNPEGFRVADPTAFHQGRRQRDGRQKKRRLGA